MQRQKLLQHMDLLVLKFGVNNNVVRIMPPLVCEEKELLAGLSIFAEVVNDLH